MIALAQRRRGGSTVRIGAGGILALALAFLVAACGPSSKQETGVVLSVDSPTLGQVDGFELLTEEGAVLTFDTTELQFDPGFPASHIAEHQVLGEPIRVTYRAEGDLLVVTGLEDTG